MKIRLLSFLLIFTVWGCVSINKQIKRGSYDQAVDLAVQKLKGKQAGPDKYVTGLETAFKYSLQSKLDRISYLKTSNSGEHDLQILRVYEDIDQLQRKVGPLLPLRSKSGYLANIQTIDVTRELSQYKGKASDYLYDFALDNLKSARNGDKMAARQAYDQLKEMEGISGSTSNTRNLVNEAKSLGTTYILLNAKISPSLSLSADLTTLYRSMEDASSFWQQVDLTPVKNTFYEYEIEAILQDFKIFPERESTRDYVDKKVIEEDSGRKDRDGKVIKVEKEVTAEIKELFQTKEAQVFGEVIFTDLKTKRVYSAKKVDAGMLFENYASTFKGDRRALSTESEKRVGGKPMPFPSNEQILGDAINNLKHDMMALIRQEYSAL